MADGRSVDDVAVVAPPQLADVVRQGSPPLPSKADKATARIIEVLRFTSAGEP